jgi:hypothetical protein
MLLVTLFSLNTITCNPGYAGFSSGVQETICPVFGCPVLTCTPTYPSHHYHCLGNLLFQGRFVPTLQQPQLESKYVSTFPPVNPDSCAGIICLMLELVHMAVVAIEQKNWTGIGKAVYSAK